MAKKYPEKEIRMTQKVDVGLQVLMSNGRSADMGKVATFPTGSTKGTLLLYAFTVPYNSAFIV